ncbi:MAG: dihydrodipicolinate synthase family protein [Planctomycetota bacterium]|jgi:hypothetical protein
MVTPVTDRASLDTAGTERLIEHILAGGVHGLFILGTTGEGPSFYSLRDADFANQVGLGEIAEVVTEYLQGEPGGIVTRGDTCRSLTSPAELGTQPTDHIWECEQPQKISLPQVMKKFARKMSVYREVFRLKWRGVVSLAKDSWDTIRKAVFLEGRYLWRARFKPREMLAVICASTSAGSAAVTLACRQMFAQVGVEGTKNAHGPNGCAVRS